MKVAQLMHKDKIVEIEDGDSIVEACMNLGVPFSCEQGYCGMCAVEIEEGADNLSELTTDEDNLGFDKKRRLACRCKIKSGKVKIEF